MKLILLTKSWGDPDGFVHEGEWREFEHYIVFMFDSEQGKIYFLTDSGEDEISYDVELFVV